MDANTHALLVAYETALCDFAHRHGAKVAALEWDMSINGGEYLPDGTIIFGADVFEILEWCAAGDAPDEAWWDLARIGAHEVLHGRRPRSAGAFEEAIVETLARERAGDILADLPGAPPAPAADRWAHVGAPYAPQVRWLERLAGWLGLTPVALAWRLKDGASGARNADGALIALIGAVANERHALGLGRVRLRRLGAQIAASAGAINAGAHVRPRSPVRAAQRALGEV